MIITFFGILTGIIEKKLQILWFSIGISLYDHLHGLFQVYYLKGVNNHEEGGRKKRYSMEARISFSLVAFLFQQMAPAY